MDKQFYAHPSAIVETDDIGTDTKIWAYTHVMKGAVIGKNCNIGDHCFVEAGVSIGDNSTIKNGNMLWEGVTLEEGVFVGPHAFFTNDLYPRSQRMLEAEGRTITREWFKPTLVKKGATVGAGSIILAGVTIGEYAMAGAGAVVSRDVPPHALVLGAPGRVKGYVCYCGLTLKFEDDKSVCEDCGTRFEMKEGCIASDE